MNNPRYGVAAAVALAVFTWTGSLRAAGEFSVASLNGVYGFNGSGTIAFGALQAAVVGTNTFDGAGQCNIRARLNVAGTVVQLTTAQCSYTVNADGTGSLGVVFNEGGVFISDFVIVLDGDEVPFSLSDPFRSTVATGTSKRQTRPTPD